MPIQRHRRGVWLAPLISLGCDPTDSGIDDALENAIMDRTQEVHAKQQNVGVSVALLKHGSSIYDHPIGRAANQINAQSGKVRFIFGKPSTS